MNKVLKIFGTIFLSLAILIAGGGYYFLKSFDLNQYKPYIESLCEKEIGRKLVINGEASIGLSLIPTIIIEDIKLANAPWAKNPQMVEVKKIEIKIALIPLLKKEIVVHKLILLEPNIYLETNSNGEANWDFKRPQKISHKFEIISSANAQEIKDDNNIELPNIVLKKIAIDNGLVKYNDEEIKITGLLFSIPNIDSLISAEFGLVYNNINFKGQTTLGSINSLLNHDPNFYVLMNLNTMGSDIVFDGYLKNLYKDPVVEGKLNFYNPIGNLQAPEISLESNIKASSNHLFANIKLIKIANNIINGKISANLAGKVPFIEANLSSNLINLPSLTATYKPLALKMPELVSNANATALVPNKIIDVKDFKIVNANLNLAITKFIITPGIIANDVTLKASLQNGILNLIPVKLNFGGGEIDGNAKFDANNKTLNLNLNSKNMSLQNLHQEFMVDNPKDFGVLQGGKVDLMTNLVGQGNTYRQLVDSLNGRLIIIVNKSVIQTGNITLMTGNFITSLIDALNYKKNKKSIVDLNCAIVRADFVNGKINFPKGLAIQSKEFNLVGDGNINLNNDKIDIALRPFSGKIIDANVAQAISNFIKIKGTIEEPKLVLDEKEAIKAIVGVVASGGTSYVGSKLFLDADSSPCYTALKETGYESRYPAPAITQEIYQDTSKKIEDDFKSLKKTAKDFLKNFR